MIRHREYSRARFAQVSRRLLASVRPERCAKHELVVGPAVDRISRDEAQKVELRPAQLGERFGPQSATFWFRIRATVPDGWRGQRVELLSLTQVARLNAGSRLFEFHTTIGWHEEHVLLKVCFPLAVRSKTAPYKMRFGYAERPTHYLTSRDAAQYEAPARRARVRAPFASARRTNALEDDGDDLAVEGDTIVLPYRPHEILTVKLA